MHRQGERLRRLDRRQAPPQKRTGGRAGARGKGGQREHLLDAVPEQARKKKASDKSTQKMHFAVCMLTGSTSTGPASEGHGMSAPWSSTKMQREQKNAPKSAGDRPRWRKSHSQSSSRCHDCAQTNRRGLAERSAAHRSRQVGRSAPHDAVTMPAAQARLCKAKGGASEQAGALAPLRIKASKTHASATRPRTARAAAGGRRSEACEETSG